MKKVFALFLATVFSSSLFAAFQYTIDTVKYTNEHYEGTWGNYFTIRITEGTGNIYIVDKINNVNSMSGNNEVLSRVMNDYGYVCPATGDYVSGTWETILTYDKQLPNQERVYQTAYKVGNFSEGDSFSIWIKNKADKIGVSTYDEDYPTRGGYFDDRTDIIGTQLAHLEYKGSNPSIIFFGFHGVGVEDPSFDGQPLPGMLATFLLGGSVLGAAGLKRRKNRA